MGKGLPIALGILAGLAACIACAVLVAVSIAIVDLSPPDPTKIGVA